MRLDPEKYNSSLDAYVYLTEDDGYFESLCNGLINCWVTDSDRNIMVEGLDPYPLASTDDITLGSFLPCSISNVTDAGTWDDDIYSASDLLLSNDGEVFTCAYGAHNLTPAFAIEDLENITDVSSSVMAGQIALGIDGTIYAIERNSALLEVTDVTVLVADFCDALYRLRASISVECLLSFFYNGRQNGPSVRNY